MNGKSKKIRDFIWKSFAPSAILKTHGPVSADTEGGGQSVKIELSDKEFRHLLDLIYIGNWILNSTRGEDRFEEYDDLQEKFFAMCSKTEKMKVLVTAYMGHYFPSKAYEEGGIHEAIADYEDAVFFDILAEELARRDMVEENLSQEDMAELTNRMNDYMDEFEKNGIDRIVVEDR